MRVLADLSAAADSVGWDGFFVWDHVRYTPPDLQCAILAGNER